MIPTTPSIKSDCPARLYVKQPKNIPGCKLIGFVPTHNHPPPENGPLNAVARKWLIEAVAQGYTKSQIERILCNLHGQRNRNEIPDDYRPYLRIQTYHIDYWIKQFYDARFKLDQDNKINLLKWGKRFSSGGSFNYIDLKGKAPTAKPGWCCFFFDNWQKSILKDNLLIYYLDSTHNICQDFNQPYMLGWTYLYTIMVRDDVTGMGTPGAYMLTNCLDEEPLIEFLKFIKSHSLAPTQFMIDCSYVEMNAIKEVFPNSLITICKWHILRNVKLKIRSKIADDKREEALKDFTYLFKNKSPEDAQMKLDAFKNKYKECPEWLQYFAYYEKLKMHWMNNLVVQFNEENVTNNYIESYHRSLKQKFTRAFRKRQADDLVCVLFYDVTPFYMKRHDDVKAGRKRRLLNKAETANKKFSANLTKEELEKLVVIHKDSAFVRCSEKDEEYAAVINLDGLGTCTCNLKRTALSWCKHLYMYERLRQLSPELESVEEMDVSGEVDKGSKYDLEDREENNIFYPLQDFDTTETTQLIENERIIRDTNTIEEENTVHDEEQTEVINLSIFDDLVNAGDSLVFPHLIQSPEIASESLSQDLMSQFMKTKPRRINFQSSQTNYAPELPLITDEEKENQGMADLNIIIKRFKEVRKKSPEKLDNFLLNIRNWRYYADQMVTNQENLAHNTKRRKKNN